jgi:hypothetical protein
MTYYSCGSYERCRDVEITARRHAIRCDDCGKGVEFDVPESEPDEVADAMADAKVRMSELPCS